MGAPGSSAAGSSDAATTSVAAAKAFFQSVDKRQWATAKRHAVRIEDPLMAEAAEKPDSGGVFGVRYW